MPKALVAMSIDDIESMPFMENRTNIKYPVIVDEMEETTWQAIRSRIEERSNDNTLVRINLSDGVDAVSIVVDKNYNVKSFLGNLSNYIIFLMDSHNKIS